MHTALKFCSRVALAFLPLTLMGCDVSKSTPTTPSPSVAVRTATLVGGSGFLFDSATTSTDDRDVWWNSAYLVPSNDARSAVRMSPLGQIADLTTVTDLKIPAMTSDQRRPQTGEAFAAEIVRNGKTNYALMRITNIYTSGNNLVLVFDFLYPR